jgi:uncharacterized Zn finger protein
LNIKITCPQCQTEGTMILRDAEYEGPYRCWKCSGLFTVRLADNQVKSCEPLSQEEFQKWQEIEAMKANWNKK